MSQNYAPIDYQYTVPKMPKIKPIICPNCNTDQMSKHIVCDNSCGTYRCTNCGTDFYFIVNQCVKGHHPLCGL